jgi:crossover junction endodeoxyribonuclease RuvC
VLDIGGKSAQRFSMTILGIDPGAHGAIAILDEAGNLLSVEDMPHTTEANGKVATNAPLLAAILSGSHARIGFVEFTSARPTDAKAAAFSFGRAKGVIEGVAGALGLPLVFLTPPTWKRIADIPPGTENKDLARTRAIARWPQHASLFARKLDIDRAEACLIGVAGMARSSR